MRLRAFEKTGELDKKAIKTFEDEWQLLNNLSAMLEKESHDYIRDNDAFDLFVAGKVDLLEAEKDYDKKDLIFTTIVEGHDKIKSKRDSFDVTLEKYFAHVDKLKKMVGKFVN